MSVKYGLLAVLDRHSMHGYDLRRELEVELGPEWAVNYGQIYSTLERLVRDGLVVQSETVSSAEAPDRKLYTVTPGGRAELREWFLTPVGGSPRYFNSGKIMFCSSIASTSSLAESVRRAAPCSSGRMRTG